MKRIAALPILAFMTMTATTPASAQSQDPQTLAGEYLGFHYALEAFDKTFCGPLNSGPYGEGPAIKLLTAHLSPGDMNALHEHIKINRDNDREYMRKILNDNFRKRRGSDMTLDQVCKEFEPVYLRLFNESEQKVKALR